MRALKVLLCSIAILAALAFSPRAQAQVSIGIGIGTPPPVCPWGYYNYAPYACAPQGFWGPNYFYNGIFLGVGPWYHWGYRNGWAIIASTQAEEGSSDEAVPATSTVEAMPIADVPVPDPGYRPEVDTMAADILEADTTAADLTVADLPVADAQAVDAQAVDTPAEAVVVAPDN